jgi:hypothetical protein
LQCRVRSNSFFDVNSAVNDISDLGKDGSLLDAGGLVVLQTNGFDFRVICSEGSLDVPTVDLDLSSTEVDTKA